MTSLLLLQKRWSVHRNYSSRWQIETHKNLQSHVSQKRNTHRTKSFKFSRIRAIEDKKAWNSAITATKNLWIYELFLQDSCFSLVIKPNFRHAAKGEGCVRFRVCVLAHGCLFNPTRHLQHGHFPFSPISDPLPPHSHSTIARPFRFHALLLFRQRTRKLIIAGGWWWFERGVCCEIKFWWENPRFWIMTIVLRMNVWNWKGMEIVPSQIISFE